MTSTGGGVKADREGSTREMVRNEVGREGNSQSTRSLSILTSTLSRSSLSERTEKDRTDSLVPESEREDKDDDSLQVLQECTGLI